MFFAMQKDAKGKVAGDRGIISLAAVAAMMCAGMALGAAPYEVAGPDAPKPHECTATNELSAYLAKRVAGTLRVGGKDGIVFRVGDTELARKNGLLSSGLSAPSATRCC